VLDPKVGLNTDQLLLSMHVMLLSIYIAYIFAFNHYGKTKQKQTVSYNYRGPYKRTRLETDCAHLEIACRHFKKSLKDNFLHLIIELDF